MKNTTNRQEHCLNWIADHSFLSATLSVGFIAAASLAIPTKLVTNSSVTETQPCLMTAANPEMCRTLALK